jgi:hypothetical protein
METKTGRINLRSSSRLRIAQLAPLYERIPPKLYGGTERVVSCVAEELAARGHDVTCSPSAPVRQNRAIEEEMILSSS